jgi:hypothetical protein
VADYRRANHVRSTAHPVPDLAAQDDWLEAPFWIWDRDDPRRRRLFARQRGDQIVLSDRQSLEVPLTLAPEGEAHRAVDEWAELSARGVRVRTRALVTTLFARLVLGDLPPEYMTVTATLRLPIAREETTLDDARRTSALLRDMQYHPERHLQADHSQAVAALVLQKRHWIDTKPTRENARQRCHMIREANERLQPFLADRVRQALHQREAIEAALRGQAILASREYAFCLYPEEPLRRLMDVRALGD